MGKNFSEFTYGVGLEITAQSFKQVKDDLKTNFNSLAKMVKSYEKVLKIDPDADLSKLFEEMRKVQSIVDGINSSDNSFSGFVDKGTLGSIAALETRLSDIDSTSDRVNAQLTELKDIISKLISPLKEAGNIKFPATFENLFNNFEDQSSKIKTVSDSIAILRNSITELKKISEDASGIYSDVNIKGSSIDSKQIEQLMSQFFDAKNMLENMSDLDDTQAKDLISRIKDIGLQLSNAIKGFSNDQLLDQFGIDETFVITDIDELIKNLQSRKDKLATELIGLKDLQSKFIETTKVKKGSKLTSIGLQSDLSAQVKVTPKTNDVEWANIINDTIKNIEKNNLLKPVRLTPTFSKSKNIDKELNSNSAQINHAVDVDIKVTDNIEKFRESIQRIDDDIKWAKELLEKNGRFVIKFEYEESGSFRSVAYKIIDKLKNVQVHVDDATSKGFLKELGQLRTSANKELKNIRATVKFNSFDNLMKSVDSLKDGIDSKLGKKDIVLNISNEPEIIAKATLIRDKLISLFGNIPIHLGLDAISTVDAINSPNNVEQLSEAAQNAKKKLEQCRQALESLQKLGFESPYFLELGDITAEGKRNQDPTKRFEELINKYKELSAKLPSDIADRWQELYPEANGDRTTAVKMAKKVQEELKKVETELNVYLQKQIAYTKSRYDYNKKILQQEREIGSAQKSSIDNTVSGSDSAKVKKVKSELASIDSIIKDLQANGFKSSEFLNLGDISEDGNKIEESTKKLKRLLTEYDNLKKRTTKEEGAGSKQWLEKYPKAKGDMAKVQQLIEKDEKRMQKIENELNQYAQKQLAFLSSRKAYLQQILSTEEQITSENDKQVQANKSDASSVNTNKQLSASAEEASKKVKSLSGKLAQKKKVLKDLEENGINSKSFVSLGEWDKKTGSFKKNKQEIQQLINRYNELKAAREKAGSKKAIGEEASLRGKLASILRQQKQHAAEIVAQNQAELKAAKEIVASYRGANTSRSKSSKGKTEIDVSATSQKIEQLTQKLNKAKSALSSLQNGLSSVVTTKIGDSKNVIKNSGRTETVKQLVSLYDTLIAKKKEFENNGISKQTVPEMNSLITKLNQAKQILSKKGLLGLSETGIGDVKGRLAGSSQNLSDLVSQYHKLLAVKSQFEKSGDTTSENYTNTINVIKGIEDQLKILRQDQMHEIDSRIKGLESEVSKKSEYLRILQECGSIENILTDVHKNQVEYARSRVELYSQQIEKEKELLQIAQQRSQEETNKIDAESLSNEQTTTPISSGTDSGNVASTVKLDSSTLNSLAKDNTLQSINGKIDNILGKLNGNINISGSNITIEASNVSVSKKTSVNDSDTTRDSKTTDSSKKTNTNQGQALDVKEIATETQEAHKSLDMAISQTTAVVSESSGEVKKLTETYRSADKVLERTEISGWVSHGEEEPPTFEHTSTVYKTNAEAFNKMYNDYIKSLAKQIELQKKIESADGPTSKMQADLNTQRGITEQLELQLKNHSELFTEQSKQKAVLEATKIAQQEVEKSVGAQRDKDVKKQNNELLKIIDSAQSKLNEMQYSMQNSKVPMADAAIAKFKQYEQLLTTLKAKQQEIKLNPDLLKDVDYSNGFNSLLQQMDAVEEEFTELQKSSTSFLNKISSLDDIKRLGASFDPGNIEQMRDVMQEFADQAGIGAAKLIEFNDAERSATFEINDGRGHIQQLTVAYDSATNSLGRYIGKTRESTSETKKFLNSLKHSFQNVARYIASFGSVYRLFAIIKQGISYVRDIDSALTELKKVTDETDASYAQFLQDMSKTGKIVGATVKDLTTMASEWARLGYSMQEAGQLAQSTAILLNVSEFDDATKASEALISTMQAFQYTADESGHVVDILNEVGKLLPVDNYIG